MAPAYPIVGPVTESVLPVVPSTAGPLTLLPIPFASDIKDKGFGTIEETLEEEVVDLGKNKGSGGGSDDDDDDEEEEDEKVPLVVVVVEELAKVDEPND